MTELNHAEEQARAQYESIVSMLESVECNYDRLEELRYTDPEDQDDSHELAALVAAAGDCTSQDEALERIQEDPLEVQVRSGWHSPGEDNEPDEFYILLCTGGPAVRIRGELNRGEPCRAWIEYQDWGKPWTQYYEADQATLLQYCQFFHFGE